MKGERYKGRLRIIPRVYVRVTHFHSIICLKEVAGKCSYVAGLIIMLYNYTLWSSPTVPPLPVDVQPDTIVALNTPPYNVFSLICTASVPTGVTVEKTFTWMQNELLLSEDGSAVVINDNNVSLPDSSSQLTVSQAVGGVYQYVCSVSLAITGANVLMTDSAEVTVRGRRALISVMYI